MMLIKKNILILFFIFFGINIFAMENNSTAKADSTETSTEISTEINERYDDMDYFDVYDPFEPLNRRIYTFNFYVDKYFLLPAVRTYKFITPNIVETGVTNFFKNTNNVSVGANSLLQFKGKKFMRTLGRFSINTIFGVFGLFDVATMIGMPTEYEDFGLTLENYGVPNGPYLVIPILGPSTVRDATGKVFDQLTSTQINPLAIEGVVTDYTSIHMSATQAIDTRKNVSFRYHSTQSPFEYEYVRFIYKKIRKAEHEINN